MIVGIHSISMLFYPCQHKFLLYLFVSWLRTTPFFCDGYCLKCWYKQHPICVCWFLVRIYKLFAFSFFVPCLHKNKQRLFLLYHFPSRSCLSHTHPNHNLLLLSSHSYSPSLNRNFPKNNRVCSNYRFGYQDLIFSQKTILRLSTLVSTFKGSRKQYPECSLKRLNFWCWFYRSIEIF